MPIQNQHTAQFIAKAIEIGFHAAGIVDLTEKDSEFENFYKDWLQKGYYGEMVYMEKNARQRFNPDMLLENAKSAVVVLASYHHEIPKLNSRYKISRYALGLDYHFVVKQKLHELLEFIQSSYPEVKGRSFTDSAPVPERYLAAKAGLGFIGKNGMLINPELGSFSFIGVLYLDTSFQNSDNSRNTQDDSEVLIEYYKNFSQCGDCDLCMRACPNTAITEPGIVDSNKCISYKTIEYKGELDEKDKLVGYIFGCDICQNVCPFNKEIDAVGWHEFVHRKEITELSNEDWQQMGSSQFKRLFSSAPLFRTGLKRIRRNIKHNM